MSHHYGRSALLALAAFAVGTLATQAPAQIPQWSRDPLITPHLTGEAAYQDLDASHTLSRADRIIVRFDMPVVVLQSNALAFRLPVSGDSLGSGASITAGPAANQVTIQLGSGAAFRTRQMFSATNISAGAPSGIEIDPAIPPGTIQSAAHSIDAVNSGPVDLAPGWILSSNALDVGPSRRCMIADANGDGAPDLFSQLDGTGLRLWENVNGTGDFHWFGYQIGGSDTGLFSLADFDRDGDIDAVTTSALTPNSLRLFFNQGSWNFTQGPNLGSGGITDIQTGDVNRDGWPDIAIAASLGAGIFLNNGGAVSFQMLPGFGSGSSAKSIALADVDHDGDLDAALGCNGSASRVFLNNGSGAFTWTGQDLGAGPVLQVLCGDLDRDGHVEICKFIQDQGVEIWGGFGDGNFFLVGTVAVGFGVRKGELLDSDGDGDLDILFADHVSGFRELRNSGTGFEFTLFDEDHGRSAGNWIAASDVDRDGDTDVVVGSDSHAKRVWRNSSSGTSGAADWTEAVPTLTPEVTRMIAAGDIDKDGDIDFVAAAENKPTRVVRNDGAGNFTTSQLLGPSDRTYCVALKDIDRDGDLDCVTASFDALQPTRVWTNDGSGIFVAGQLIYGGSTSTLLLDDFDGDGDPDLVTCNASVARVRFNNGYGTFLYTGLTLGNTGWACASGDLDRDGDVDLVITGLAGESTKIYLNQGNGYFLASSQSLDVAYHHGVQLVDFDGDGDLDMVQGSGIAPAGPMVYTNDGAGIFTNTGQVFPTQVSPSIATGDVDQDGDVDLVLGNNSTIGVPMKVWLNDGASQFTDSTLSLGNYKTSCVLLADLDRDGDLDLLESVDNAGPVRVWFHR